MPRGQTRDGSADDCDGFHFEILFCHGLNTDEIRNMDGIEILLYVPWFIWHLSCMVEEQQHGFAFEKWVVELAKHINPSKSHLLAGYMHKWDLPTELNPDSNGGPISIKTAKWNSSIGFGDARRQFQIDHKFTLVVGFWEQDGLRKRVVKIVPVFVEHNLWMSLWKPIEFADLKNLDDQIKNRSQTYRDARQLAQRAVNAPPFSDSIFRVNPKIDSKVQRRLQCSLTQEKFFSHLAPNVSREKEDAPSLWGQVMPHFLPGQPRFGAD